MWIFKWAFRFPTCTQTGAQKGPLGTWLFPKPLNQEIMDFVVSQRGRAVEGKCSRTCSKMACSSGSHPRRVPSHRYSGCCVLTLGSHQQDPTVLAQGGVHTWLNFLSQCGHLCSLLVS